MTHPDSSLETLLAVLLVAAICQLAGTPNMGSVKRLIFTLVCLAVAFSGYSMLSSDSDELEGLQFEVDYLRDELGSLRAEIDRIAQMRNIALPEWGTVPEVTVSEPTTSSLSTIPEPPKCGRLDVPTCASLFQETSCRVLEDEYRVAKEIRDLASDEHGWMSEPWNIAEDYRSAVSSRMDQLDC